jgi:hypothetical protein
MPFCLSDNPVTYKSRVMALENKKNHVSAADEFKPHDNTFLNFIARDHTNAACC